MTHKTEAMKRIGKLYEKITDINNLYLADALAQRGKSRQYGVIVHNKNQEANILNLNIVILMVYFK